jgi:hypothetical protein
VFANYGRTVNKLLEGIPSKNFVCVCGGGLYLFGLLVVAVKEGRCRWRITTSSSIQFLSCCATEWRPLSLSRFLFFLLGEGVLSSLSELEETQAVRKTSSYLQSLFPS